MTIFFKLAQELLVKDLAKYIEDSRAQDQSLIQSACGRNLELSAQKRLLAQSVIDAIAQIQGVSDEEIQIQLDKLLRKCKANALEANQKYGGREGHLEDLIDARRKWLERLLKKITDNNLLNIPDNKHPFSVFCQKMVKYFDHKIYEELTEWRASHTVRQSLGFTSMPHEKSIIIHKAVVGCIKRLYRLDRERDYAEGSKDAVISVLTELGTKNSEISSQHAVAISAPIPTPWNLFGIFRLPLGKAQPSEGYLKTCITEALQEINAQLKADLQRVVTETRDEFKQMFEEIVAEEQKAAQVAATNS